MRIRVNEREADVPAGETLFGVRARVKPDADVVILNGAPLREDRALVEGDAVVLIRRGEQPSGDELEALMMARHTPGVHQRMQRATVGIAGLGGLGSAVAVALARIGVGRLVLADFDVVEPSNLNRQQYFIEQIGWLKTEALTVNLLRINPHVDLVAHPVRLTPENVPTVFAAVDVLVEAFDVPDGKAMLLESFSTAFPEKPLVACVGLAGHYPSNDIRTARLGRNVYVVGDLMRAAAPGTGLMAPRVGIAAHHQANAVLRLLLGEEVA
jgi:sulfur carrier protein ThiS adenylyltransferase